MWAQFTFHNETKSQLFRSSTYIPFEFNDPTQNYTIHITGLFCNLKPTILKAYKEPPTPDAKPLGQTSAFIEGMGMLDYTVGPTRCGCCVRSNGAGGVKA
ncbi:unnamed protein product [Heligmosomoides polygyrus]|uniref:COBRA-like protein n=1 Tax=Heligmosomoides polygyrus TaxID=6339 RepID=A0A183GX52_HELPZ|nr:unnamed protein product [Heligmosomoides polygyrus]